MKKFKLKGKQLLHKHADTIFKQMLKGDVGHLKGRGIKMRWVIVEKV